MVNGTPKRRLLLHRTLLLSSPAWPSFPHLPYHSPLATLSHYSPVSPSIEHSSIGCTPFQGRSGRGLLNCGISGNHGRLRTISFSLTYGKNTENSCGQGPAR